MEREKEEAPAGREEGEKSPPEREAAEWLVGQDLRSLWEGLTVRVAGGSDSGEIRTMSAAEALGASGPGRALLVCVPAAFSPACSERHLPGVLDHADALHAKGVSTLLCLSVNDPFVMRAWWRSLGANPRLRMLCDGDASLASALRLLGPPAPAMGARCRRAALLLQGGVVTHAALDPPATLKDTSAEAILAKL